MRKYFDVQVLSTCALDYLTWHDHYPAGTTDMNGVAVQRFPVDRPRDIERFNKFARKLFAQEHRTLLDELAWIEQQGPMSSALLEEIRVQEEQIDLFVFVTYSYLTSYLGLQLVPRKSVLIPAAHDEPHFYFSAFQPMFHLPRGILYNTPEEKMLVERTWQNTSVPSCIAGAGMTHSDTTIVSEISPEALVENANVCVLPEAPYLLYIGRVDVMKGCQELVSFFLKYVETYADVHLVLIGKSAMQIPEHSHIHALGFVSEAQKTQAIQQAALLVNPSSYESLSLVILEAWQLGTPVLVNGRSDVLAGHCLASNGGLYYTNYEEFRLCLEMLLAQSELRETLGRQGQQYVAEHYSWDVIEKTYVDFFTRIGNT
jgi:glycosyltransferase involved in cell wall biosynthesis